METFSTNNYPTVPQSIGVESTDSVAQHATFGRNSLESQSKDWIWPGGHIYGVTSDPNLAPGYGQIHQPSCALLAKEPSWTQNQGQTNQIVHHSNYNSKSTSSTIHFGDGLFVGQINAKVTRDPEKGSIIGCTRPRIKRPMNCFMLWSRQMRAQMAKEEPKKTNGEVSKILGHLWKTMPKSEKLPFIEKAEKIRQEHLRLYPDYKYRPVRKRKSAQTITYGEPTTSASSALVQTTPRTDLREDISSFGPTTNGLGGAQRGQGNETGEIGMIDTDFRESWLTDSVQLLDF